MDAGRAISSLSLSLLCLEFLSLQTVQCTQRTLHTIMHMSGPTSDDPLKNGYDNDHMGQFPEDGNFGRFMSNFLDALASLAFKFNLTISVSE